MVNRYVPDEYNESKLYLLDHSLNVIDVEERTTVTETTGQLSNVNGGHPQLFFAPFRGGMKHSRSLIV